MNRDENLRRLANHGAFDALVIGGGIVGAGCARDLASRGLSVALVEKRDWGHGTTARSTRLIHGGLRYLEQRDFGLVREALGERERLLRLAPALVHPLPFVLPLYAGGRHNRALLKVGMTLYDAFSFHKSLPGHQTFDANGILALEPGLSPHGLRGGATYYDAQVESPERLCWENVRSAAGDFEAVAANYASVARLLRDKTGRVAGAEVCDERTGTTFPVVARLTINATGPWVEETLAKMLGAPVAGTPPPQHRFLRRTKGAHLVVPQFTRHAVVLVAGTDGRVFFVVPWRGLSIVGTTDTDFEGDPNDAAADENDVAYLQAETRRHFPNADVETIFYTWAGVRALVRERSRSGMSESQVSRKDKIHDHASDGAPGLVSVLGGKITAYRAIAEQLGALVVDKLNKGGPSRTANEPLGGADFGAGEAVAQVERAAAREMAVTLGDALLRRSPLGFAPTQGLDRLDELANAMACVCGWDAARTRAEKDAYVREIAPMRRFSTAAG